ncbi:hypothetical protein [Halobellus limi]|jgi:hypothetical protein|uniref:Uncharacterized protein n=1 Tax=Halobellus limi TaxID=699433 RepID=A0A1H6ANN3_9EURY|nr:hypothetical protein [Halobellus limi]QCC47655.1 hypothetical protein DV707_08270 [Halobellus limi]SEG49655.1 hypothetical protein SAMN04488133_2396 [Halobellus limi]
MSRSTHDGSLEPRAQFVLDLTAHGFDLDETTPRRVAVDLVRDSRSFALDVGTESDGFRVALRLDPESGRLEPARVYRGTALIASSEAETLPGIDQLDEWLRFVIEHATEDADVRTAARSRVR